MGETYKNSALVLVSVLFLIISSFNAFAAIADHVIISEVYYDAVDESNSEYIELYNPTSSTIDISGWVINTTSSTNDATIPASSNIPAHSFFLIADSGWFTGKDNSGWPNANYEGEEITLANSNGGVQLLNSLGAVIDVVGWGSADSGFFEGTVLSIVDSGNSSERKSSLTHNENEGNGWDTNNNSADFVTRTTPQPQNSSNSTEHKANKIVCSDSLICDYTTIQGAIDAAISGDTINVSAGTYNESADVNKNVTILGSGVNSTIVNPGAGNYGFKITSDGVTISNLQIATVFIIDDTDDTGIMLLDADNVEISNNKIISTSGADPDGREGSLGIWICGTDSGCSGSNNLVINQNAITINGVSTGIYAEQANSGHSGWQITSNTITADSGVTAELYDVTNSEVTGNTLDGSTSHSNLIWSSQRFNLTNLSFDDNIVRDSLGSMVAIMSDIFLLGDGLDNTLIEDVTVNGNTFSAWGSRALRIGDGVTNVIVSNNKFLSAGEALKNEDALEVNATNNYWNHATGPGGAGSGFGANVSSNVAFYPWYTDSALTTLADATTSHSSTIEAKTITNLTQDNAAIQIDVTLNNTVSASAPMYNAYIQADSFEAGFASSSTSPQSCGAIPAGSSCTKTFDVTVNGGTTSGLYHITWKFNWTNNDGSPDVRIDLSTVTITDNPIITTTENITKTISHGTNSTFNTTINSTGNAPLNSVVVNYTTANLLSDWVTFSPTSISSIAAGSNALLNITVAVPKGTAPGNYTGTFTITADSAAPKNILLRVTVPTDDSWNSYPSKIDTFRKTNVAGIVGTIFINNTGNVNQTYTLLYAGAIRINSGLWDTSNPAGITVPKQTTNSFDVKHKGYFQPGSYDLNVTVKVGSATNNTIMNLTLENNNPNVNLTSPLNDSFVNGIVDFNVTASDLNLSRIEFYINNVLALNDTGIAFTFKWNTTNGTYPDDVYSLRAIAIDSAGNFNSTGTINVTVNNTDDNPILKANIPPITLAEENSTIINLSLFFKTIDGDSLNYSFTPVNNITVNVDNNTQTADIAAQQDFFGTRYLVFYAIDSSNNVTASNNITITVNNINDVPSAPALSAPLNNSVVFSVNGNVLLNWSASTDADNDPLTYYVFYGNDTNLASSTTTQNTNVLLINLNNATTYYWRVFANDGTNNSLNSSTFQFTVTLDSVPIISSFIPANLTPSVAENSILEFNVTAADPDGGTLNFSWYVDAALNKTDGNQFNYTPSFGDSGTHTVAVNVTDNNSNSVSNTWIVAVTNTNRVPVLDAILDEFVDEDELLSFNVSAFDPDGDNLTFNANVSGILFTNAANNSLTTFSWTPTNDFVGDNVINVSVSDSSLADSQLVTITVSNTNDNPVINSFSPTQNKTIASNVGSQRFEVLFSDIDAGDSPTVAWFMNGTPIGPSNASNVTLSGLNTGIYNITVVVTDSASATARQEWVLNVTGDIVGDGLTSSVLGLNEAERQSATNVTVNHSTFGGIDFGSNVLNFSGVANLEDAFNISNGLISVDTDTYPGLNKSASLSMKGLNFTKAPLINTSSGFESTANGVLCSNTTCTDITYDVDNGILRFNVAHFTTFFAVMNTTNGAPIITSVPITTASTGEQYRYDVEAADPDGDTLTYSLTSAPSGMSIGSSSGLITFTPTSLGNFTVAVEVSDGNLTDTQSYNLAVGEGARLRITDLDIKVGSKTDKNVQNNTRIKKEAAPGDKVQFDVEIKNFFTDEEDLEIEDIDVEITIEDIDDGDDLEEDADEFDLKAGKDESVSVDFEVPLDVEEDTFDVIINVEGRDENGTTHEIRRELQLDVEKESHEIRIVRASAIPSEIKCQRTVSINTEIINTGAKDEDDVTLEIFNSELGINSVTDAIELDEGTEDNRYTKSITAAVSNDVASGIYPITVNTYYGGKLSNTETINLAVQQCEQAKEVKKEVEGEEPRVEVIRPAPKVEEQPEKPIEISFIDTDLYFTLLAIIIVIFIGTAMFILGAAFIILRR
ncbi:lamin tail domain-containing protein [Candidatus Woesearchaeota archaeon]|nr:lamin tail domain-containing protein [Candidatus Woesearchaeota archaeon]